MIERWPKTSMIFGAALILIGVISACFKAETELKYANVGGDYRWVRPIPTSTDAFILGMPGISLVLAGAALLIAGYLGKR